MNGDTVSSWWDMGILPDGFSYLDILFQFVHEYLFVVVIDIDLLSLIDEVIILQRWQLFGLHEKEKELLNRA